MHSNMTEETVPRDLQAVSQAGQEEKGMGEEGVVSGPGDPDSPWLLTTQTAPSAAFPSHTCQAGPVGQSTGSKPQHVRRMDGEAALVEKVQCPDLGIPSEVEVTEGRQTGLEEPQLAREASHGEGQNPLESAKTPDVAFMAASSHPPRLEPMHMDNKEQLNSDSLQLPVLHPEGASVLRKEEQTAETAVSDVRIVTVNDHGRSSGSDPTFVNDPGESSEGTQPKRDGPQMRDVLKRRPVVLLKRLSPDLLESARRSSLMSKATTKSRQYEQLTVAVDDEDCYSCGPQSAVCQQVKQDRRHRRRTRKEKTSPLTQMLEQSQMWNDTSLVQDTVRTSPARDRFQLDVNRNSQLDKVKDTMESCVLLDPKVAALSKTLRLACSNGKTADQIAFKRRRPLLSGPPSPRSRAFPGQKRSPKYNMEKLRKQLKLAGHAFRKTAAPPTAFPAYSSSALKMTIMRNCHGRAPMVAADHKGDPQTGKTGSCPTPPPVEGWENRPDIIFDCGVTEDSYSHSAAMKAFGAKTFSLEPVSSVSGVPHEADSSTQLPSSSPPIPCSSSSDTAVDIPHTTLYSVTDDSIVLPCSQGSAVHGNTAHHNAADSLHRSVPSSQSVHYPSHSQVHHPPHTEIQSLTADLVRDMQNGIVGSLSVDKAAAKSLSAEAWKRPAQTGDEALGCSDNKSTSKSSVQPTVTDITVSVRGRGLMSDRLTNPSSVIDITKKTVHNATISSTGNSGTAACVQNAAQSTVPHFLGDVSSTTDGERRRPVDDDVNILQSLEEDDLAPPILLPWNRLNEEQSQDSLVQPVPAPRTRTEGGQLDISIPYLSVGSGGRADSEDTGCMITCIEKTSPAFVIPHREEKMLVESDMIVMQNYYGKLQADQSSGDPLMSGCCQQPSSIFGSISPETPMISQSSREPGCLQIQAGEVTDLAKPVDCLSSQGHMTEAGILMIHASASGLKTSAIKVSPGRQRTCFRRASEGSEDHKNAEFKDIELSAVVVHMDCLRHADDLGSQSEVRDCEEVWKNPADRCSQAEKTQSAEGNSDLVESFLQSDTALLSYQAGDSVQVEISEDTLNLQDFDEQIVGQVQIRKEDDDVDEVFEIVNERDVPLPHDAFLHSLSLLRNTHLVPSQSPQATQENVLPQPVKGRQSEAHDDSDATLPYPRDEHETRTRSTKKHRRPKKSRKRKQNTASRTSRDAGVHPEDVVETSPSTASTQRSQVTSTKLIDLPSPPSGGKKRRKKSVNSNRHPLFKARHQAASRQPKGRTRSGAKRQAPSSASPDAASSPVPAVTAPNTGLSSSPTTTESDNSNISASRKVGSVGRASAPDPASESTKSSKPSNKRRSTIAIDPVVEQPQPRPARKVRRPSKGQQKRKQTRHVPDNREEKAPGVTEGIQLTDEESEPDELPAIHPPKRRRQQSSLKSASGGKAASAAMEVDRTMQESLERIKREFPRHNWLEHKILQRNTYTPPAGGLRSPSAADSKDMNSVKEGKRPQSSDGICSESSDHFLHSPSPLTYSTGTSTAEYNRPASERNFLGQPLPITDGAQTEHSKSVTDRNCAEGTAPEEARKTGVREKSPGKPGHDGLTDTRPDDSTPTSVSFVPTEMTASVSGANIQQMSHHVDIEVTGGGDGCSGDSGLLPGHAGTRPTATVLAGTDREVQRSLPLNSSQLSPMILTPAQVRQVALTPNQVGQIAMAGRAVAVQGNHFNMPRHVFMSVPLTVPLSPVQVTAVPGSPHMTQLTKVPILPASSRPAAPGRRWMPIQPKPTSQPADSVLQQTATRELDSVPIPVSVAQLQTVEDQPPSAHDADPGESGSSAAHLNRSSAFSLPTEDLNPTSLSAHGDRPERLRNTTEDNDPISTTATSQEQDEISVPPMEMPADEGHENVSSTTPGSGQTLPRTLHRSKSCGSLLGKTASKRPAGAARRKSWEQTRQESCEEDEVQVIQVELGARDLAGHPPHSSAASPTCATTTTSITTSMPLPAAPSAGNDCQRQSELPSLQVSAMPQESDHGDSSVDSRAATSCPDSNAYVRPASHPSTMLSPSQIAAVSLPTSSLPRRPPPVLIPTPTSVHQTQQGQAAQGEESRAVETLTVELDQRLAGSEDTGLPLDLCTKKTDLLAGSRIRSHLPVQLVLPQVQPRTTISSSTSAHTTTTTTTTTTTASQRVHSPTDIITNTKRAVKAFSDTIRSTAVLPSTDPASDELTIPPPGVPSVGWTSRGREGGDGQRRPLTVAEDGDEGAECDGKVGRPGADVAQGPWQCSDPNSSAVRALSEHPAERQSCTATAHPQDARSTPERSPPPADGAEEERLRTQLRDLERLAALKQQERDEVLQLHKRKLELLAEMESKKRRTSSTDSMSSGNKADGSGRPHSGSAGAKTEHPGARGAQSQKPVSRELEVLQMVMSQLSTVPEANRAQVAELVRQTLVSGAAEVPRTPAMDLSATTGGEGGRAGVEHRSIVQMISQAIHCMTQNAKTQHGAAQTTPIESGLKEEGGTSLRPAHQVPKEKFSSLTESSPSSSPCLNSSPYSWRTCPLNEPPLPASRYSQHVPPTVAHSQPPFQPAGSLIVPTKPPGKEPQEQAAATSTVVNHSSERPAAVRERERGRERAHSATDIRSPAVPVHRNVIDLTTDNEDKATDAEGRVGWVTGPGSRVHEDVPPSLANTHPSLNADGLPNQKRVSQLLTAQTLPFPVAAGELLPPDFTGPAPPRPGALASRKRQHSMDLAVRPPLFHTTQQQQPHAALGKRPDTHGQAASMRAYPPYAETQTMMNAVRSRLGAMNLPPGGVSSGSLVERRTSHSASTYPAQHTVVDKEMVLVRNPIEDRPQARQAPRTTLEMPGDIVLSQAAFQERLHGRQVSRKAHESASVAVRSQPSPQSQQLHRQAAGPLVVHQQQTSSFLAPGQSQQQHPQHLQQRHHVAQLAQHNPSSRPLAVPPHHQPLPHSSPHFSPLSPGAHHSGRTGAGHFQDSRMTQQGVAVATGSVHAVSPVSSYYSPGAGRGAEQSSAGRAHPTVLSRLDRVPQEQGASRPAYYIHNAAIAGPGVARRAGSYPSSHSLQQRVDCPPPPQRPGEEGRHQRPPVSRQLPPSSSQTRTKKPEGVCALCGTNALYMCSTCRAVWYCSHRCQTTHWRLHSTVCKPPA